MISGWLRRRSIMSDINPLSSSKYFLKRLEDNMLAVHRQMEVLKIVFKNLEGSWFAISPAHKVVRDEIAEER